MNMGVGRTFFHKGASRGFSQNFFQELKSGEMWFLSLEIEKTIIFANNFKIQGGLAPMPSPSDVHAYEC